MGSLLVLISWRVLLQFSSNSFTIWGLILWPLLFELTFTQSERCGFYFILNHVDTQFFSIICWKGCCFLQYILLSSFAKVLCFYCDNFCLVSLFFICVWFCITTMQCYCYGSVWINVVSIIFLSAWYWTA